MDPLPIALDALCGKWKVIELSLFGSVLRDDFRADSDIDVLVRFTEDAEWSLFDLIRMEEELGALLGRKVGLVEFGAVERSENYIRRNHILSTAEPIFVAQPRPSTRLSDQI
jgi:predicted nucleotidyltransferase